ncbi:MAG: efflux RND transporter permease subunit [Planctomycetota bacterium]
MSQDSDSHSKLEDSPPPGLADGAEAAKTKSMPGGSFIELAIDRPVAVTMVVLAVAVFGFVALQKLSMTLLPKISYPTLTVRTEYEGAAPSEVEELITKTLESNLSVTSGLNSYRSLSRAGVSDIILEFEWDRNMSFAAQDVREKVDQVRSFLPRDAKKPLLLKYDPTLDPIMRFGLYGGDLVKMRFAGEERIKKKLESIAGVAAVRVKGGFESEIRVDLNENELRRTGVSLATIQQRLKEENVNLASGLLREGDVEFLVRTLNEFRSINEIRRLVVATTNGQLIRLQDVARVHLAPKEPDVITSIDGRPSVELAIFKEDSANIVTVADAVKRVLFGHEWRDTVVDGELDLKKIKAVRSKRSEKNKERGGSKTKVSLGADEGTTIVEALPPGMKLRLLSDQSRFIKRSVDEVKQSGIFGALFAILVLMLFLRRAVATLIIAVSIPISVIATFGPMMQFGVSLNVMSLGGLALGIGMLVDASIVVLESIDRCRKEGDSLRLAALRGTKEVGGAVIASVLTTVAVFLPIIFVDGIAGEIFKDQSLTVVFSLLTSLVVAIFFIPMLAARPFNSGALGESRGFVARLKSFGGLLRKHGLPRLSEWQFFRSTRDFVNATFQRPQRRTLGVAMGVIAAPAAAAILLLQGVLEVAGRFAYVMFALILGALAALAVGIFKLAALLLRPLAWLFDRAYAAIEVIYAATITAALRLRLVVVIAAGLLLFLTYQLLDDIGMELIPEMHSGELIIESPQRVGTLLETTARLTQDLESTITNAQESGELTIVGFSTAIGVARDEIAPSGEGTHTAKLYLKLPPSRNMAELEEEVITKVRKDSADSATVRELTFSTPKLFSFKNPLEVQIKGDNLDAIEDLARALEARLQTRPEISDLKSTVREGNPEFIIIYDRVLLADRGLSLADAAATVRDKIKGVVPTKYSVAEEGRKIDVLVKIPEGEMTTVDALRNLQVNAANLDPIRLTDVAEVRQSRGPSEIRHIGGERVVFLTARPQGVDLDVAADAVSDVIAQLRSERPEMFRGVVVKVAGQTEEAERSRRDLMFALALALILVYIVMASQFESLLDPLVIMISSVFAAVGAVFALYWFSIAASVVVFIGGIMLAGIVVNNAIVLIDNINRLHRQGMPRREAIIKGGRMRLRPILMTTMTTVLGLVPMAISTGEGAEMRVPMAVTVIAGLISSTALTLVIIPVVYSLAHSGVEQVALLFGAKQKGAGA